MRIVKSGECKEILIKQVSTEKQALMKEQIVCEQLLHMKIDA